ncbi:hypothetical protein AB0I81_18845 [Nonomuraea sp. NPDC050404]|uniref:hypothetical protein n=1 Tax=Nonomuraea sp. NPDC050404 TaxID=3155783 RepID=UPI0034026A13
MTYLVVAVIGLTLLCVLNLVFTYGVVRRLREHGDVLAAGVNRGAGPGPLLAVGEFVGEFSAFTTEGEPIDRDSLVGRTTIAFFSTDCDSCHEQLPVFVDWAAGRSDGSTGLLAVVEGARANAADMVAALRPVARVVTVTDPAAGITTAFRVRAFPSFFHVEDGVVRGSTLDAADLAHTFAA